MNVLRSNDDEYDFQKCQTFLREGGARHICMAGSTSQPPHLVRAPSPRLHSLTPSITQGDMGGTNLVKRVMYQNVDLIGSDG